MLTAGCIDELYLLIIPRVLNEKDAPSVFGDANVGKISPITFMLRQTEPKPQGTVLLHYTK
jgi:riboflavin biosynthesis pyrimidine reductase